ncbi:hypothetical protein DL96DRAFT_1704142 [Flagelloscypha sp. PMI_526]|nr:hypothetical protein DL96DRAFT_1704142 [Flagelloscypha sp. PMI_526]
MVVLPPELFSLILAFLDGASLKLCRLVNRDLRHFTQQYLFYCFSLNTGLGKWEDKCNILLGTEGRKLLPYIRKLLLRVDEMSILARSFDPVPVQLTTLIQTLGPQLHTLCINGTDYSNEKWFEYNMDDVNWSYISSEFREILYTLVMPFVHTLEFQGISGVPIFTIFGYSPRLQNLWFDCRCRWICELEERDATSLPKVDDGFSLIINTYNPAELEHGKTSLVRFFQRLGSKITSLKLGSGEGFDENLPPAFDHIQPFTEMNSHLLHLHLGRDLFDSVLGCKRSDRPRFPLASFSRLQTLTLEVSLDGPATCSCCVDWNPGEEFYCWFDWIAASIEAAGSTPLPLKIIRSNCGTSSSPPEIKAPFAALDGMALDLPKAGWDVQLAFFSSGWQSQTDPDIFAWVRSGLPSWHLAGRLQFWTD